MKKLIHDVVNLKFLIGLYFFGILIVYTCVLFLLKENTIEIVTIWQILGLSACLGLAHLIYFTKMNTAVKIGLNFGVCLSSILIFNYVFGWGVIESVGIFMFSFVLLIFYVGGFVAFYIYYKNEEQLLNRGLSKLKNQV